MPSEGREPRAQPSRPGTPDPSPSPRWLSQWAQRLLDVGTIALAYLSSFYVRFDGRPEWTMIKIALLSVPYVVSMKYALLSMFGVPQFAWRYVGLREAVRIAQALSVATLVLVAVRVAAPFLARVHPTFRFALLPFGVIAIDSFLCLAALVGIRTLRRAFVEQRERSDRAIQLVEGARTLIVGAGDEGVALARMIEQHPELGVEPIGFVDDDPRKHGSRIQGVRVLGGTRAIAELCKRFGIEQAILAMPEESRERIREILAAFDGASIPVKVVPSLGAFVSPGSGAPAVRPIELEDLLRRSAVTLADEPVERFLRGRSVLVTGAGGSIGSELCRQIASYGPARLVLLERSEHALYEIHRELAPGRADVVVPLLADVTDAGAIERAFRAHAPSVVFHAAAHKHVPMLESHPAEAVRNNLGGTKLVADAARRHGSSAFVLISTDKAVNPSSVMGATKRAAELHLQSLAIEGETRLTAVRFGNVLGSSGSVVPLFREQIARGGPVTVTDPAMRRYFMTIPEACNLVLHAGALGEGGEIFILDMGEPVRIADLAEDLIRLSGFVPGRDVRIEFTGLRPGEKLFEELSVDAERADRTRHPKIFVAKARPGDTTSLRGALDALLEKAARDDATIVDELRRIVPEFRPDAPPSEPR